MHISNFTARLRFLYQTYPRPFWTLVLATFIDTLGGYLLYPFLAFYVTKRFGVGMTTVGVLMGIFSLSGFLGSGIGGALSDRFGRRSILIFSLLATSLTSLLLGFAPSIPAMFTIILLVGTITEMGHPTYQAIVSDLLPEEQRAEGFSILRIAYNVSAAIGPALGGFIASQSYLALFVSDAVVSLGTAAVVFLGMPETKPQLQPGEVPESIQATFRGYLHVLKDRLFLMFILANIFSMLAFVNVEATLGVFLRDVHGVSEQGFGWLLTINALLVVFFQFWLTRRLEKKSPLGMMALGALLYGVGFAIFGFAAAYGLFLFAIALITFGEMIQSPIGQTLASKFSPEDMRGRYMAVFGLIWLIPSAIGPYLGGLILDHLNPNLLWYAAGVVSLLSVGGFIHLKKLMEAK